MQTERPLHGLTLVLTRPRDQAARTAAALRKAGADVIEFPVIDIEPISVSLAPGDADDASAIIFVSANAVAHGVPAIQRAGDIPPGVQIMAIGRATAMALTDADFKDVVSPQQSIDSEGLLVMPQLRDVKGRHIILVKGMSEPGGRQLLQQTLTARGARVTVFECYRRVAVVPESAAREAMKESLASGRVHACFALSVETLDSLIDIFSIMDIAPQSKLVLLVPHARVAAAARSRGFDNIAEVPMAESELIAALTDLKPHLIASAALPLTH